MQQNYSEYRRLFMSQAAVPGIESGTSGVVFEHVTTELAIPQFTVFLALPVCISVSFSHCPSCFHPHSMAIISILPSPPLPYLPHPSNTDLCYLDGHPSAVTYRPFLSPLPPPPLVGSILASPARWGGAAPRILGRGAPRGRQITTQRAAADSRHSSLVPPQGTQPGVYERRWVCVAERGAQRRREKTRCEEVSGGGRGWCPVSTERLQKRSWRERTETETGLEQNCSVLGKEATLFEVFTFVMTGRVVTETAVHVK